MERKKEDPEKVKARVKKYLESKQQLLITGLSNEDKELFLNIPYLETLSHGKKLMELIHFWIENHPGETNTKPKKPEIKSRNQKKK
jgi:hypothetical protein